ncbi:MAG: hypothetical protein OXC29_22155 [Rhodococcus sp.]|nr:hypothetical protein [Rhodococcus sp. (in: high G+C Gram-positive bacteria)]
MLDRQGGHLPAAGSGPLADDAHVFAVDPITHHTYYPVTAGTDGRPALLERSQAP